MRTVRPINAQRSQRAFTLVEIAVVLLIIVFVISAIAVPISTQIKQRRYDETRKLLETAKDAILGFATANGRLPCPASAASNGLESFAAGGTPANGNCSNFYDGFLPGAALGLAPLDSQGYVVDSWATQQNRIRYAVMNSTVAHSLTATNGMQAATMTTLSGRQYLNICASGTGVTAFDCGAAANNMTNMAPFALLSLGPNAPIGGTGTDEAKNIAGNPVFVTHDPTPETAANGEFDDIVTWVSINTLFSRMMAAGKLP